MKSEKALTILFIISIIFQFLDIPIKDISIVISLLTISILYFPFGFYFLSYNGLKNQKIGISITFGFFFSISVLSILFKIMIWPGADFMLYVSVGINIIFLIIVNTINKRDNLKIYYKNLEKRIIILLILTFIFAIPKYEQVIKIKYWNNKEKSNQMIEEYRKYHEKNRTKYRE